VKITTLPLAGTLKNDGSTVTAGQYVSAADIAAGKLVFTPATGATGSMYATFTFQVQDNGGTSPGVDLDPVANNFTVRVLSGTNTAPTLAGAGTLTVTSSPEDSTSPTAKTISQLLTDSGPGTTFSDPDAGSSMSGLAIVGNTANASTQGKWQYSVNGTTWTDVGSVGNTATTALALSAATQVRFLSVTDYNGTPPALSVRVLDDTYSGSFSTVGSAVFVGTTAFASTAISPFASVYSLGTTVTPVNDAPVLTVAGPTLTAITAAQTNNTGQLVSSFITTTDLDASAVNGIAVIGIGGSAGTWQYTTDGTNWFNVGTVGPSTALLLRSTDRIRYNPDGTGAGSGAVTYRAWDQTSGTFGTKVDATVVGNTTAFSNSVDSASIAVTAVTTIPTLTIPGTAQTFTEGGSNTAVNGSIVVAADSGNNNITGATITLSGAASATATADGSGNYTFSGLAGFWPALWGALVVSVTNLLVSSFLRGRGAAVARPPARKKPDDVIDI